MKYKIKLKSILTLIVFVLLSSAQFLFCQTSIITGKVKDSKGSPIPSASIRLKGTGTGTSSDSLGEFSIHAGRDAALTISAIGYRDTTISIHNQSSIAIVLTSQSNALNEVVVAHSAQNSGLPPFNQVANNQMVADALDDYVRGEGLTSGIKSYSGIQIGERGGGFHKVSTAPLNTINYGAMLPVFTHKEDTRGSRYLFDDWVKGLVVGPTDSIVNNAAYLYNYDKITGDLLLTTDKKTAVIVDKPQVKAFALKGNDTGYVFERVPEVTENDFLRLIAKGPRYSAFRSLRTKLVKADHTSNGYTESGNFYDEYVDQGVYYFVDAKTNSTRKFELRKKSILEVLPGDNAKVTGFFAAHKHDTVNEDFIKELIRALNQ